MDIDVEQIIQCIKQGEQDSVQTWLQLFNSQYAQCFFFNAEERERKKQQQLEEFRKNKVRDKVPDSDSDWSDNEDPDVILRRRLAAALIWFIRMRLQPSVLRVSLCTLRILARDRQALAPLSTDTALLTLAQLGGLPSPPLPVGEDLEPYSNSSDVDMSDIDGDKSEAGDIDPRPQSDWTGHCTAGSSTFRCIDEEEESTRTPMATAGANRGGHGNLTNERPESGGSTAEPHDSFECRRPKSSVNGVLVPQVRAKREWREVEEGEEEDDGEVCRREAMMALCNIIYHSHVAQERASALSLLPGLSVRLKAGIQSSMPPSGQFYELRLLFLLTALRPELRRVLQQERGVSMLTSALEKCLSVQWGDGYEVLNDTTAPPVPTEVAQHAIEILKTLFNITHSLHRQEPDEEDAALYRHLAAVLRHCLLLFCDEEGRTEELQRHVVNVLSALPLRCLDVLLSKRLSEGSHEWEGINMDSVHALLLFLQRTLDRGQKLKEKLTPVLSLLTESCRVHRETRHYLRQQILPPLRDIASRPEEGSSMRSRLVRLMTHVDTDVKHCAAELLFVLCKENVRRFVKYTGYGNAAGLLAARGLLGGGTRNTRCGQYSSDSDSDTEEYREAKARINPVTGRVEEQQPDPMEGMTEEEKEQEAWKLICMFNRLSRDKIIQPAGVTAEGRLAPLDDQLRNCTLEEESESEEESEEDDREK